MSAPATAVRAGILDRVLRDFASLAQGLPADARASSARRQAAARLAELGWPSVRDEQWRYANLRAFEQLGAFLPAVAAAAGVDAELPAAVPGFERLIYLDGIQIAGSPQQHDDAGTAPPAHAWAADQRLGLLGDMFAGDAARLTVRGEAAIEILFISSGHAAAYPRLQLRLEPGSQLRLIERHLGGAQAPALVACNVTIEMARAAVLTHYRLQQYAPGTVFADTLWAHLSDQARYSVRSVAVGAGTARTSAHVQLAGRGAALAWHAIAVGRGQQVHDIALKVEHSAADTSTEEMFRGIADERARVAFSGHIHIAASAPGSQARQSLRGLIEGAGAEIDLRPRLEINDR